MEQLDQSGKGIIQFDFVNNPDHQHILGLVTLDKSKLEDPGWLAYMQECVLEGGTEQRTKETKITESIAVSTARRRAEAEMGLRLPDHPLHGAYKSRAGDVPLIPASFLSTVAIVQDITGNAIGSIRRASRLIAAHPATVTLRYNFIDRASQLVGWQGNPNELIAYHPDLLAMSMGYLALLARIIQHHGTAALADIDANNASRLTKYTAERHLLSLMTQEMYELDNPVLPFELKQLGAPAMRDCIHESLTDNFVIDRLGRSVVKAYLRVFPIPYSQVLDNYPHLNAYMPRKSLPTPEKAALKPALTGNEAWLADIPLPPWPPERWEKLHEINELLRIGSRILNGRSSNSPEYDETLDARSAIFEIFGWANPKSPIYGRFVKYFNQLKTLPTPMHIVDACNTLEAHGITNGIELIGNCFEIIHVKKETLDSILCEIEAAGLSPHDLLEKNLRFLVSPPARRAKSIAHHLRRSF